jgi:hypothetical protein
MEPSRAAPGMPTGIVRVGPPRMTRVQPPSSKDMSQATGVATSLSAVRRSAWTPLAAVGSAARIAAQLRGQVGQSHA